MRRYNSFCLFTDASTTEIYTLSLHDALPICRAEGSGARPLADCLQLLAQGAHLLERRRVAAQRRSEEHTSELQSLTNLVCRLLLEKKKNHHILLRRGAAHVHIAPQRKQRDVQ